MDLWRFLDEFAIGHYHEHADQLDGLRRGQTEPAVPDVSVVPVPDGSPFPLHSLPFGIGRTPGTASWRAFAAIGDHALDLSVLESAGVFAGTGLDPDGAWFARPQLNHVLALGPTAGRGIRDRLVELLTESPSDQRLDGAVVHSTSSR
jgi:fumarylacetoacetase